MSEERYVAAIEISSSKIIGTVGIPRQEGFLEVVAVEQERCTSYVRMGFIHNIDETAYRVNRVIEKLQRKSTVAPRKITKVFVGISGRSMRSIPVQAEVHITEDATVDKNVVQNLCEQARHMPLDGSLDLIDCVPRMFLVDKRETSSPIGWVGKTVEATYDLIVCRPELRKNIIRVFDKVPSVHLESFIVTAMAAGQIVLSEEDKIGCMLVDCGAETTTVTIYTHGALCYYATLPMGSHNITRDITTLKVPEDRAEEIKKTSGNAIAPETPSMLEYQGVKQSDVSDLVVARAEEITANIIAQIQYAGLTNDDLPGGIILIGGGSKLNGLVELVRKLSYLKVRRGELPSYITIVDTKVPTSETIEVVSVLYAAAMNTSVNCLERPQAKEIPEMGEENPEEPTAPEEEAKEKRASKTPKAPSKAGMVWRRFTEKVGKMFTAEDDDDENDSEID